MARKSLRDQKLGIALGIGVAFAGLALALPAPAQAQRGSLFDNWFTPFPNTRPRPEVRSAPADYSRAPAPARRTESAAPTSTVLVVGDAMADWLAYGLEDALGETPEFGVVRKH